MRLRLSALVCALALLLLTACTPQAVSPSPAQPSPSASQPPEPSQGTPNPFALAWDPEDTLDPLLAGNANQLLADLVFEGLFALDASFTPRPVLCASYVQAEDGLSWTFTLRGDVTFSDGTPLTAGHAAASLNAARASALYGARLAQVEEVSAGEGTVTVLLSAPNGALPALLDIPIFLCPEEGYPLGTGPYRFDDSSGELCLRAVDRWWQRTSLPLDTVLLRPTPSADRRIAAFDTGLVTLVDTDLTGTNSLGYSGHCETWDYPTTALLYLGFNTLSGPCRDPILRQALSRGIERTSLAASLLSGHAEPSVLPVSPRSQLYDADLADELAYSLSAAGQLLDDGGYQAGADGVRTLHGRPVTLTLLVNSENTFRTAAADHLAAELAKLGVSVTVSRLPWDSFLGALERGEFDLCLNQVKLTADFDLSALLTGELNYGGFEGEELSALLDSFRAASGDARRTAASALYAQLASDAPFAPLCFMCGSILTQWGSVSGLTPTQSDPFYGMEGWSLP